MASSGTYTNAFKTGYSLQLRWYAASQDITNNTTTVRVETWLVNTYSTSSSATKNGSITINGSSGTYTFTVGTGVANKKLFERTVVVAHNSDGTKTVALSTYADINLTLDGSYVGRVSVSGSPTLDAIPRRSTFSTFPNQVTAGTLFNYAIARASSSFTHEVEYDFGSNNLYQTGIATSGSHTIPLSWLNAVPDSTSGTMVVTLHTYNGGTYIGNITYNITVIVPTSVVPTVTSITAARVNNTVPVGWGVYVQNKSSATLTINGAAGVYGSTITAYEISMGTTVQSGASSTFSLPTSGTITFTGKVTDSRGRVATTSTNITVEPYSPPAILTASVTRSTSGGVDATDGTYAKSIADYEYSLVNGSGAAKNSVTTLAEYKVLGAGSWTNAGTFTDNTAKVFGGGGISTDSQYEVRLSVTDAFSTVTWSAVLNTAFVTMDFLAGGHGIAFGKVSSLADTFESDFAIKANSGLTVAGGVEADTLEVTGLINALGGFTPQRIPEGANFNTYTTPGQWYNESNASVAAMTNKPSNNAGALVVYSAATIIQYWHEYDTGTAAGNVYRRRYYSSAWSSWELYQGPKLFDTGSDSNGYWYRFPTSGLQICWRAFAVTNIAINNTYGSMFISNAQTWTYPRAFTSEPAVTCGQFQWGSAASWGSVISRGTSSATYRGLNATTLATGTSVGISLLAVGIATS